MIDKTEQVIEFVSDNEPLLQCAQTQNEYFQLSRGAFLFLQNLILFNYQNLLSKKEFRQVALSEKAFFDSIIET